MAVQSGIGPSYPLLNYLGAGLLSRGKSPAYKDYASTKAEIKDYLDKERWPPTIKEDITKNYFELERLEQAGLQDASMKQLVKTADLFLSALKRMDAKYHVSRPEKVAPYIGKGLIAAADLNKEKRPVGQADRNRLEAMRNDLDSLEGQRSSAEANGQPLKLDDGFKARLKSDFLDGGVKDDANAQNFVKGLNSASGNHLGNDPELRQSFPNGAPPGLDRDVNKHLGIEPQDQASRYNALKIAGIGAGVLGTGTLAGYLGMMIGNGESIVPSDELLSKSIQAVRKYVDELLQKLPKYGSEPVTPKKEPVKQKDGSDIVPWLIAGGAAAFLILLITTSSSGKASSKRRPKKHRR